MISLNYKTMTHSLRRAKFSILCAVSEILDFVAGEILNFNHYSYLTAHLDSVLRSAKIDISPLFIFNCTP